MLASMGISCHRVSVHPSIFASVCLSVTSWCSTETPKHRIIQTMPHRSPGTLVFWCQKSWQNSNGVTPNGGTKCRWGRLNAVAVPENWRLSMQSVVNLVRSQVCHTEQPRYLLTTHLPWCSTSRGFLRDSWSLLPAALREAQTCRYLVYSEANFEVFRPAGATRCTDGGEIWHGGGDLPSSMPNFTPIGATTRV